MRTAIGLLFFLLICLSAPAEEGVSTAGLPEELSGTLKRIHESGTVVIGYRESSVPFSYLNSGGDPIGYSIDIGHAIVDGISNELDGQTLKIKFVPVTPESRIAAVVDGRIDLECGSTTNNVERQKQVAFSPIMFVAGTKLMVKRDSPIQSFRDLGGKRVVVTEGTTNQETMKRLAEKFAIPMSIVSCKDHAESFGQLVSGKADAFAGDDVLLRGLLAKSPVPDDFAVIGEFLSYDPYGIMFRKDDPQLAQVIDRVFRDLARSRDLEYTYNRWFLGRLPSGEILNLPMSAQLEEVFRALGAPD